MGYPESIPILKGKAAKEFLEKLENFKLTDEQKQFWKDAFKKFAPPECKDDCVGNYRFGYCIGCSRHPHMRDKYEKA